MRAGGFGEILIQAAMKEGECQLWPGRWGIDRGDSGVFKTIVVKIKKRMGSNRCLCVFMCDWYVLTHVEPSTDSVRCVCSMTGRCAGVSSHQVVLFEIELQDGVFDSSKHKADVLSVRGARKVGVDDLVAVGIQVHKHLQDELPRCLSVSLGTYDTHTHTLTVWT